MQVVYQFILDSLFYGGYPFSLTESAMSCNVSNNVPSRSKITASYFMIFELYHKPLGLIERQFILFCYNTDNSNVKDGILYEGRSPTPVFQFRKEKYYHGEE